MSIISLKKAIRICFKGPVWVYNKCTNLGCWWWAVGGESGGEGRRRRRERERRWRPGREEEEEEGEDRDERVRFCDGGDRESSELRTDLIPSLPPECALRVASLRWAAVSSFSAVFWSSSRLWMDEFGGRMQPCAKSPLPALVTIFPSISTATSLTANASQWAYFHTRLSPNVIHHQDKHLFSFREN